MQGIAFMSGRKYLTTKYTSVLDNNKIKILKRKCDFVNLFLLISGRVLRHQERSAPYPSLARSWFSSSSAAVVALVTSCDWQQLFWWVSWWNSSFNTWRISKSSTFGKKLVVHDTIVLCRIRLKCSTVVRMIQIHLEVPLISTVVL